MWVPTQVKLVKTEKGLPAIEKEIDKYQLKNEAQLTSVNNDLYCKSVSLRN